MHLKKTCTRVYLLVGEMLQRPIEANPWEAPLHKPRGSEKSLPQMAILHFPGNLPNNSPGLEVVHYYPGLNITANHQDYDSGIDDRNPRRQNGNISWHMVPMADPSGTARPKEHFTGPNETPESQTPIRPTVSGKT